MADDGLLEAVRGLYLAHPELGPKPLLAKLREQQPDMAAGNKEVREALVRRALELPRARRRENYGGNLAETFQLTTYLRHRQMTVPPQ